MSWPLFVRRLVCRFKGCDTGRIVKHTRTEVIVGEGCRRCEVGSTTTYPRRGPLPADLQRRG